MRELATRRLWRVPSDERVLMTIVKYGFDELDRLERLGIPMSYAQIAASLGFTLEAVRLIEARALAKVRAALGIEQPAPVKASERTALARIESWGKSA